VSTVFSKNRPFLKWPGNKFNCLAHVLPHLPQNQRLIEPFLGSGAIFLNTDYPHYLLAEINQDVIELYMHLQQEGTGFIEDCAKLFIPENNQKERYYALREEFNVQQDRRRRAALFLYLNRHGYNGLCRYNNQGVYNVPFGRYTRPYFPWDAMRFFCQKSQQAVFIQGDFRTSFAAAKAGDVIYCDPPYSPLQQHSNFSHYAQHNFGEVEHHTLVNLARETAKAGIPVLISNHDTPVTRDYYHGAQISTFSVSRFISRDISHRKPVQELIAVFL